MSFNLQRRRVSFAIASSALRQMADMDANLMIFVNILGVITFSAIVFYHLVTATPKDAEG